MGRRIATVRLEISWEGGASSSTSEVREWSSSGCLSGWVGSCGVPSGPSTMAEYSPRVLEVLLSRAARILLTYRGPCRTIGLAISQPRLMTESASIIASDTHTIHPLLPSSQSSTGPGAHPRFFARGERKPQPIIAPRSMCKDVEGPMMIPCPTYAGEGLRVQSQPWASVVPKMGRLRS